MALTAKEKREQREHALRDEGARDAMQKLNQSQFQDPGSTPSAHGEVVREPQRGRTVIVACKLGVANFAIQLCKIVEKRQEGREGPRTIPEAIRVGNVVTLRGTAYPRGTPPEGFPPPPIIVGGAALNFGIDAEFWEEWVKQNEQNPIVANKLVFAHENKDQIEGMAKELAGALSGLDPVNPKKDPRITKSTRRNEISDVEPADRGKGMTG